jgi:inorganic pyrophosphatase
LSSTQGLSKVKNADGSLAHPMKKTWYDACVVGDTVGDPFKDTSGPALNILMKLMAILSLVFAQYFESINGGKGLFKL